MIKFYDTCALLKLMHKAFENYFIISSITLKELENIKTSTNKDSTIKYQARQLIHLLDKYSNKYEIINYQSDWDNWLKNFMFLSDNNDSRIIISAYYYNNTIDKVLFVTEDLCCKQLAATIGLNVQYLSSSDQKYCGYKEIIYNSDEELAKLYSHLSEKNYNWNLLNNEYLIIKSQDNNIIDKYRYVQDHLEQVPFLCFESRMFGKIKPKDDYQLLAMNSFKNNKITMVRGSAGTGKSYLALGYLFSQLEKGKIDKIIIFCNTVATMGSAKLGLIIG